MNVPDFYVNSGVNKTGVGYREVNWSLPRERQAILGRMNIYDAMWTRIPWRLHRSVAHHGALHLPYVQSARAVRRGPRKFRCSVT